MENGDEMINRQRILMALYMKWVFVFFLVSQLFFNYTVISQGAIIILCAAVALVCLIEKRFYFNWYFVFALLFIIQSYIFSVNGVSINSNTSMAMTNTLIINFIMALALYNYIMIYDNLEESLDIFAKVGILLTVFIPLISFQDLLTGRLGSNAALTVFGKLVVFESNSIAIMAGFIYLIYLYKYTKTKDKFTAIALIWLVIIVILTGSRKGLLLLLFGTPLLLYLLNPQKRFRNLFISVAIVLALYGIIISVPLFYDIMGKRVEALVGLALGTGVGDASTNSRSSYIESGWNYFLLRPWTGYGLDTFRHLPGSFRTYSHNNYIELLVSGGIPALIFYYIFRFYILIRLLINFKANKINAFLFVTLLIMIILEYGFVSYFERMYIIMFIFILSGYELNKNPIISEKPG